MAQTDLPFLVWECKIEAGARRVSLCAQPRGARVRASFPRPGNQAAGGIVAPTWTAEKISRRPERLGPDATSMASAHAAHIDYSEHPCSQPRSRGQATYD